MTQNKWNKADVLPDIGTEEISNTKQCITKSGKFRLAYYNDRYNEWYAESNAILSKVIAINYWRDIDLPQ